METNSNIKTIIFHSWNDWYNFGIDKNWTGIYHITVEINNIKKYECWLNSEGNEISLENDSPSEIFYNDNGNGSIISKHWSLNGIPYRENNKPTSIVYHDSGEIDYENWETERFSIIYDHCDKDNITIINKKYTEYLDEILIKYIVENKNPQIATKTTSDNWGQKIIPKNSLNNATINLIEKLYNITINEISEVLKILVYINKNY